MTLIVLRSNCLFILRGILPHATILMNLKDITLSKKRQYCTPVLTSTMLRLTGKRVEGWLAGAGGWKDAELAFSDVESTPFKGESVTETAVQQ